MSSNSDLSKNIKLCLNTGTLVNKVTILQHYVCRKTCV